MKKVLIAFRFTFFSGILILLVTTSALIPADRPDMIRLYTRDYEFDYLRWTIGALWEKISAFSLGINHYTTIRQQKQIIKDYMFFHQEAQELRDSIVDIYSNPDVVSPEKETAALQNKLSEFETRLDDYSLLAEMVIQDQIAQVLGDEVLINMKQLFPPVLYNVSELPNNLIVSPRSEIKQDASLSLFPGLNLYEIAQIEQDVENFTDYSALIVPVGGVSTYPTMVIDTSNLFYLIETVAHEWTHNYLIFRPLGIRYSSSPQLRTMNETTASITGEEISSLLIKKFYSSETTTTPVYQTINIDHEFLVDESPQNEPVFDFHRQMYETRMDVDALLAEGKIEEAEQYMENQRQVFWENGYHIRKLNQAYFAFHGAYADAPFSAAGADPVGADVRALRSQSKSLGEFINRISRMTSYDNLRDFIHSY